MAEKTCQMCGEGVMRVAADNPIAAKNLLGVYPSGIRPIRVERCSDCGHIEIFMPSPVRAVAMAVPS